MLSIIVLVYAEFLWLNPKFDKNMIFEGKKEMKLL